MERTLKMRAYKSSGAESSNLSREQELELDLAKKSAQLEEEKKKSLETLKALEHMREVLKDERAKAEGMQGRLAAAEETIKQLRQTLGQIAGLAAGAEKPAD
jgi:cysteinyl-tRNA synthetase